MRRLAVPRYLDSSLITLTAVSALPWYVLWVRGGPPRVRRRIAVIAIVAFVATVVAHQIKIASVPEETRARDRP